MYYKFIIHQLNCLVNLSYEDRKNVVGRGDFIKGGQLGFMMEIDHQ